MATNWQSAFSRVRAALMRRGRTQHEADDLVQEAWIRLACYELAQTVARPEAFLMRAALNLSVDTHRMRMNHGEEVLLDEVVLIDSSPTAEAVVLARERIARLNVCLARLSAKTRDIFLSHRVDGMSYLQIAQRNNLSISTVEKHIAKATLQVTGWMEGW
jgi:RNA polymerase sigma-70 factor (ECF subfamily)